MADMCRKGLHELTEGNLIYEGNVRRCMACRRQWSAAYYAEHRERILEYERERSRAYRSRPEVRERVRANAVRRRARIMSDPVLREAEAERRRVARTVRYATDADYREAMKQSARERYAANRKPQPTTITVPASLGDAVKRLGGGQ